MDLDKMYDQARSLGLKPIFVFLAHCFGIYTCMDLVRIGKKLQLSNGLMKLYYQIRFMQLSTKLRIEIPSFANIGENFTLVHASSVVIHENAKIGNDVVVFKGVSIGAVRGGKRQGVPIIEDRVVIHANAVVCGGIHVGHDSLIAGGSFVDFDVPPHSVVIGNPGMVYHKENASRPYLNVVTNEQERDED